MIWDCIVMGILSWPWRRQRFLLDNEKLSMNNKYYWSMAQNRSWLLMLYGADLRARIKPQKWLLRVVSLQLASGPAKGPHSRQVCPAKDAVCITCKKKGHYSSQCFCHESHSSRCNTLWYNTSYISQLLYWWKVQYVLEHHSYRQWTRPAFQIVHRSRSHCNIRSSPLSCWMWKNCRAQIKDCVGLIIDPWMLWAFSHSSLQVEIVHPSRVCCKKSQAEPPRSTSNVVS